MQCAAVSVRTYKTSGGGILVKGTAKNYRRRNKGTHGLVVWVNSTRKLGGSTERNSRAKEMRRMKVETMPDGMTSSTVSVQIAGKICDKAQHALCSTAPKRAVAGTPEVLDELVAEAVDTNRGAAEEAQPFGGLRGYCRRSNYGLSEIFVGSPVKASPPDSRAVLGGPDRMSADYRASVY